MTEILAIDKHALALRQKAREEDLKKFKTLTLETVEQEQWAAEKVLFLAKYVEAQEVERTAMKRPVLDDAKAIDDAYRPSTAPAKEGIELLKKMIADAARARMRANESAVKGAQTLALAGDSQAAQSALATVQEPVELNGASTQEFWNFEIVDPNLVPDRYKVVSAELVQADLDFDTKAQRGPTPIPGVRHFKDVKVRRTSGKKAKP